MTTNLIIASQIKCSSVGQYLCCGWMVLYLAGFLASTPDSLAAATSKQAHQPPNIIVIFCDNLGYGDIEPFGSKLHRTPNLNRMAAEGTRFTNFYVSSGVCTPSRASLMTGCYAQRINLHHTDPDGAVLRPVSPNGLHPDEITIAEILKEQGYATGIFGKWHLGDQRQFLPTRQGFDVYFGIPYSDDMTPREGKPWPPLPLMRNERVVEAPVDRNDLTRRETEEVIRFIKDHQNQPFFVYLPHSMPGSTGAPFSSERFRGKSNNGPWGDAIEELDWATGQILETLRECKLDEKTLVIWTSDNGAPRRNPPQGLNLPMGGWGYSTAEGGMRVPCIVRWPGKVPAGNTCHELATTMDLLPTFAYLAGAEPPRDRIIDGKDIRSLLFNDPAARSPHIAFYYYQGDQLQAVRSGPWKLYLPIAPRNRPMLYDVMRDPGETTDVADQHADLVRGLAALAQVAREDLGDQNSPGENRRPAGRVEQVRALALPSQ